MNGGSSTSHPDPLRQNPYRPDNSADDDDADELDFFDTNEPDILSTDPLHDTSAEPLSFKRKQKSALLSSPARLLSALTGASPSNPRHASPPLSPERLEHLQSGSKDGVPLDWYVEGPGRRVGYEDLTAIDWIFEYTKERQRLRVLASSASGLFGYAQLFLDASQVWVVLVLTGLAVGALAAAIDVATDWLGDIKYGFCSTQDGGAFYLSKMLCCTGYEELAKCSGWKPWGAAFGASSGGGKWIVEYVVYLVLAVSCLHERHRRFTDDAGDICSFGGVVSKIVCYLCQAQRYTRDQDGVGWLHYQEVSWSLDFDYQIAWFDSRSWFWYVAG